MNSFKNRIQMFLFYSKEKMTEKNLKHDPDYLMKLENFQFGCIKKNLKFNIMNSDADENEKIILDYLKMKKETKLKHAEICKELNISTYRFNRIMKDNEIDSFYRHPVPIQKSKSKKTKDEEKPKVFPKRTKSKSRKVIEIGKGKPIDDIPIENKLDAISDHESEEVIIASEKKDDVPCDQESEDEFESTTIYKPITSSRVEKFKKELLAAGLNG